MEEPLFSRAAALAATALLAWLTPAPLAAETSPPGHYKSFAVSIYVPVTVVKHLSDPWVLGREWREISSQLNVDKVYLEAERSRDEADDATLERVKAFFVAQGVRVAGGITFSDGAQFGQFRSFCYTNPADRAFVKAATELVARHFDEIVLDDFFFVTTKDESDIRAKGSRSWTDFRLELMDEAGRDLVLQPAKAVNPRARVIIKYPNWYEHFQGLGFDLAAGPKMFDGIYTGTETRDPHSTDQYLQQYESYEIVRYFENIAPGRNGGGWVDTFSSKYVDRYAEQLWDTVLAKAREMTLFSWPALLQPVRPGERAGWAGSRTSFNYDGMLAHGPGGEATMARAAGYALDQIDPIVRQLGTPIGLPTYRPPHATGEDFLHNYLGLLGLPLDLRPTFPEDAPVILLTEDAKGDPQLVEKIKRRLRNGKAVVITSGLASALQGHGLEDIVELQLSNRKIVAEGYVAGMGSGTRLVLSKGPEAPILFPQVGFLTNDAWALLSAVADGTGYPLLLEDSYGDSGRFYVWTMPDNFHQLYQMPAAALDVVRAVLLEGFPFRLQGPSQISLFAYDNRTCVVESFRPEATEVDVAVLGPARQLRDLATGERISVLPPPPVPSGRSPRPFRGEPRTIFHLTVPAHSYRAFAVEP